MKNTSQNLGGKTDQSHVLGRHSQTASVALGSRNQAVPSPNCRKPTRPAAAAGRGGGSASRRRPDQQRPQLTKEWSARFRASIFPTPPPRPRGCRRPRRQQAERRSTRHHGEYRVHPWAVLWGTLTQRALCTPGGWTGGGANPPPDWFHFAPQFVGRRRLGPSCPTARRDRIRGPALLRNGQPFAHAAQARGRAEAAPQRRLASGRGPKRRQSDPPHTWRYSAV